MGYGIWLVLLGVLAVPSLIIAKKPNAKELIAKITPYQGWIGAISFLGGIWWIITSILNIGWMTSFPIRWATLVGVALLQTALGLILGIGTLKTFIKNAQAQQKMDDMLARLQPKQGTLGIVAIGLGVWSIVSSILF
jgi:hypothetical protein